MISPARAAGRRASDTGYRRDRPGVVALTAVGKGVAFSRGGPFPQKDKVRAFAELECRGHDVRGNPPAQIKQILKRRPSKQKSKD
jgi:hypothetical protein